MSPAPKRATPPRKGESGIDTLLSRRRIIVTCGTGGVGKTTVSAALAMRAAMTGRNALVITIDPAKRLKTSLGLDHIGNDPMDLTGLLRKEIEAEVPGRFSALVPDTQATFESFIASVAMDSRIARRVIENPIFQIFSKEFSGSNEYMAMQRLLQLSEGGGYDCIILDTPPSRNALAFLDAPKLLARFFDEKLVRWLVLPANSLVSAGMRKALGMLERLTGARFMTHLLEFATALFEVRVNFSANLGRITKLLESDDVGFLLVAAASPDTVGEAIHFVESLADHHLRFEGVALNRTLQGIPMTEAEHEAGARIPALLVVAALQAREKAAMDSLEKTLRAEQGATGSLRLVLPELARDVHGIRDLGRIARLLAGESPALPTRRSAPHGQNERIEDPSA